MPPGAIARRQAITLAPSGRATPSATKQEALALAEHDLSPRRGSLLVRNGNGSKRREVGMDEWGWEQLRPWLSARAELPVGALFCIIDGPTR